MIIDRLENCEFYYGLGINFKRAFEYLKSVDLNNIECGKYEIDGNNIFISIMEYTTKNIDECLWEAHKKYIDIQYVISGSEKMGYINVNNISIINGYNSDNDILFGEGVGQFTIVKEGEFTIFTPNDGHMPSLNVNNPEVVKKAVIKILI